MNERIEVNTLQEKLTEFLNNIGISGPAEITEDTENNTYTVKIDNYKFFGFYPSTDNSLFTLQVVRGDKELPSGMFVDYIEAFVFFSKDFLPYQFIIYEYPQMQTLYLMDDDHFKKGTLQYEVNCPCSGQRDVRILILRHLPRILSLSLNMFQHFVHRLNLCHKKLLLVIKNHGEFSLYKLKIKFLLN